MVKACVDQDLSAAEALSRYPKERDIVSRCVAQMHEYGWSLVKACADQDIEAATALARYPAAVRVIGSKVPTTNGEVWGVNGEGVCR